MSFELVPFLNLRSSHFSTEKGNIGRFVIYG